MKRIIPILILILMVAPAAALNDDAWPEAMADWDHRVPITITNPPADGVQRMVTITFQEGMQADFDDVRMYTSSGSAIDYWIEDYTASTSTDVWFEQPSTDTYVYVYYDNPTAADASDADATFDFYDDFSGSELNTDKWTATATGGTVSVSDGSLSLSGDLGAAKGITSDTAFGGDIVLMASMVGTSSVNYAYLAFGLNWYPGNNHVQILDASGSNTGLILYAKDTSTISYSTTISNQYTSSKIIQIQRIGTNSMKGSYAGVERSLTKTVAGDLPITLGMWDSGNSATYTFDWVIVKKYDASETTFVIGDPEECTPVDVLPFPGYDASPTDPDGDGLYEDCNGNGRIDFNDLLVLFRNTGWAQANQPTKSYFDWNGNGKIEFGDVVAFWGSDY